MILSAAERARHQFPFLNAAYATLKSLRSGNSEAAARCAMRVTASLEHDFPEMMMMIRDGRRMKPRHYEFTDAARVADDTRRRRDDAGGHASEKKVRHAATARQAARFASRWRAEQRIIRVHIDASMLMMAYVHLRCR